MNLLEAHRRIAWMRAKLLAMTEPEKFPQEYPLTPEDAFMVSGRMVFNSMALSKMEAQVRPILWTGDVRDKGGKVSLDPDPRGKFTIWLTPKEGHQYIVSGDVASGIEGDEENGQPGECFSVADVIDAESWEQVAQWRGRLHPEEFGDVLCLIGAFYNWAWLIPEVNNHGLTTCVRIQDNNYPSLHTRMDNKGGTDLGFFTSPNEGGTRAQLINSLRSNIKQFTVRVNSKQTISECRSFVRLKNGKLGPLEGTFSDCVISLGIGLVVLEERGAIPEAAKTGHRSKLGMSRRGRGSTVSSPSRGAYQ